MNNILNACLQEGMSKEEAETVAYWQGVSQQAASKLAMQHQIDELHRRVAALEASVEQGQKK